MRIFKMVSLVILIVLVACNQEQKKLPEVFDLKDYLGVNISYLDSIQPNIKKEIRSKDSTELIFQSNIDWEDELSLFKGINWSSKLALQYRVDSIFSGNRLSVHYVALDSNLEIQALHVEKLKQLPDFSARIRIIRNIEKEVYSLKQELYFEPASGYFIKGKQEVPTVYREPYNVIVNWDY